MEVHTQSAFGGESSSPNAQRISQTLPPNKLAIMKQLWIPLSLLVCFACGWFVYQDSLQSEVITSESSGKLESVTVGVTTMRQHTLEEKAELVGSLKASTEVGIRPRISGYITRLPYDVGDFVEADQVVLELDDQRLQEAVKGAKAALQVAEAQLKAQQAGVEQAQRDVQRQIELKRAGASTPQTFEAAEAALKIALAKVELEKAHVAQAKFDLRSSELALDQTRVKMPTAGYVAERNLNVGDLADPGVSVLRIVKLNTVRTVVNVVEKDYQKINVGQKASIGVDAFPSKLFPGTVLRKAPVLDPATRTAAVQIEIPNRNGQLKPGMHARVSIVFNKRPEANVVPIAALLDDQDKTSLYVIDGEPPQTRRLQVKTGLRTESLVQILDGLDPEDRVVTLGSRLVSEGQEVSVVDAPWTLGDQLTANAEIPRPDDKKAPAAAGQ